LSIEQSVNYNITFESQHVREKLSTCNDGEVECDYYYKGKPVKSKEELMEAFPNLEIEEGKTKKIVIGNGMILRISTSGRPKFYKVVMNDNETMGEILTPCGVEESIIESEKIEREATDIDLNELLMEEMTKIYNKFYEITDDKCRLGTIFAMFKAKYKEGRLAEVVGEGFKKRKGEVNC